MKMLAIDADVTTVDEALNDLALTCGALRGLRDELTDEDAWKDRGIGTQALGKLMNHGLYLSAITRHLEQLAAHGQQMERTGRKTRLHPKGISNSCLVQ